MFLPLFIVMFIPVASAEELNLSRDKSKEMGGVSAAPTLSLAISSGTRSVMIFNPEGQLSARYENERELLGNDQFANVKTTVITINRIAFGSDYSS